MRDRIEPLVDGAVQLGLPAGEHVAHRLDADRRLRLQPRQLGELAAGRLLVARAQAAHRDHRERGQSREPRDHDHDRAGKVQEIVAHRATLHRSDHKNKK